MRGLEYSKLLERGSGQLLCGGPWLLPGAGIGHPKKHTERARGTQQGPGQVRMLHQQK